MLRIEEKLRIGDFYAILKIFIFESTITNFENRLKPQFNTNLMAFKVKINYAHSLKDFTKIINPFSILQVLNQNFDMKTLVVFIFVL